MTVVTIRPALAGDIPVCATIEAVCYPPEVCEGLEFFQNFWEQHGSSCWVATDPQQDVVGYAFALPTQFSQCPMELNTNENNSIDTNAVCVDTMYLHDVAVAPQGRGRGIGTLLFQRVQEHATISTTATTITLTAVCGAWDYWKDRHGFRQIKPPSRDAQLRLESYPKECGKVRMMQRQLDFC